MSGELHCLHVIPAVAPRYGGPSQMVLQMARALRQAGTRATIATTDADGPGRLEVPLGRQVSYQGVPAIFFRRQGGDRFKYSAGLARWLGAGVGSFQLVHVHAVFSHSSMAAAAACRRAGVPYLVRPLGSLDPWSLNRHRWQKRLLGWVGADRMLAHAAAIHYTSSEEMRRSQRPGLAAGLVVPLGIEFSPPAPELLERFRRRRPGLGSRPYVLALQRLHPKKRLDLLIRAFARVGAETGRADWRLLVAGDGDPAHRRELERLAREQGAAERVLFLGWLDSPLKEAVLAGAELAVLASHQENFGVAAAEAMMAGVPVLVSRQVNLAGEIESLPGGWVSKLDEASLTGALREALDDPGERRRRGRLAAQWARRRYCWERVARQLESAYRGVLEGARVGAVR